MVIHSGWRRYSALAVWLGMKVQARNVESEHSRERRREREALRASGLIPELKLRPPKKPIIVSAVQSSDS